MALTVETREITPEEALAILERNENNRTVRHNRVQQYARDMKSGKWRLNGSTILFNGSGKLIDGQHRLLACVVAGKPFTSIVISGLTDADHSTIDTGMTRTFSDELRWRGETRVASLAAVCLLGFTYDNDQPGKAGKTSASRAELISWLKKNPDVRESVLASNGVKDLLIRESAFAITHYLVLREHGADAAAAFRNHLISGTDYGEGDPCLALRRWATTKAQVSALRPSTVEWFAICLKSANHFLRGQPIQQLGWKRLGAKRENFPAIVTREEAVGDYADYLS